MEGPDGIAKPIEVQARIYSVNILHWLMLPLELISDARIFDLLDRMWIVLDSTVAEKSLFVVTGEVWTLF